MLLAILSLILLTLVSLTAVSKIVRIAAKRANVIKPRIAECGSLQQQHNWFCLALALISTLDSSYVPLRYRHRWLC